MEEFMQGVVIRLEQGPSGELHNPAPQKKTGQDNKTKSNKSGKGIHDKPKMRGDVSSVTMVYCKAVPVAPGSLNNSHESQGTGTVPNNRKVSASSDELIDTSDENLGVSPTTDNVISRFITGIHE